MKVGSLVESIKYDNGRRYFNGFHYISPVNLGQILTVREICTDLDGTIGLLFEEIINGNSPDGTEFGYIINNFREIQPPIDISELIEQLNVCACTK